MKIKMGKDHGSSMEFPYFSFFVPFGAKQLPLLCQQ